MQRCPRGAIHIISDTFWTFSPPCVIWWHWHRPPDCSKMWKRGGGVRDKVISIKTHIADIHEDQGNGMLQLKQNLLYRIDSEGSKNIKAKWRCDSEGSKNIKAKWRWKIHSSLGIIEKLLQRISLLTFFIFFFRYWNK